MPHYIESVEDIANKIVLKPSSQLHDLFSEKDVEENMLNFIKVLEEAGMTEGNTKDNPAEWLHVLTELDEKWHDEMMALLINPKYKLRVLLKVEGNANDEAKQLVLKTAYATNAWTLRYGKHTLASILFPSSIIFVDDLIYTLSMRSPRYTTLYIADKGEHYRTELYEAINMYYTVKDNLDEDKFFIEDRIGMVIQRVPETILCLLFLLKKISFEDGISYPGKNVAEYICNSEEDASDIEDDPVAIKKKYLTLIKTSNAFKNFIKTYYLSLYQ